MGASASSRDSPRRRERCVRASISTRPSAERGAGKPLESVPCAHPRKRTPAFRSQREAPM